MNHGGYIQLHRQLLAHPLMANLPAAWFRLWVWILLSANWKPGKWWDGSKEITVAPGSLVTSLDKMSRAAGTSRQQTRGALGYFEAAHMATCHTTNRYTIVTICNWDVYQNNPEGGNTVHNTEGNTPATRRQHTEDHNGNNNLIRKKKKAIRETNRDSDGSAASRNSSANPPEPELLSVDDQTRSLIREMAAIRGEQPTTSAVRNTIAALDGHSVTAFAQYLAGVHQRYRPGGHRAVSTWKWFESTAASFAMQFGSGATAAPVDAQAVASAASVFNCEGDPEEAGREAA